MCKKSASSQSSTKGSTAAPKAHSVRRNDASSTNPSTHPIKATSKPPAVIPAYDEQVNIFSLQMQSMEVSLVLITF